MSSVAGTPSPEPSTPPTSPAKSTPPSSPKKVANAAKKEEAKKAKEMAREMEKAKKWRGVQRGKVEKVSAIVLCLPMSRLDNLHRASVSVPPS